MSHQYGPEPFSGPYLYYLGFPTSGPSRCKISTGRAQIPFSLESIRGARPARLRQQPLRSRLQAQVPD